jgi:hypothetical protein
VNGCSSNGCWTGDLPSFWRTGARAPTTPTAAGNTAALIERVAAVPGRRVLNSADPDAPSGMEIARTIAGYLGHEWDEVLREDGAGPTLGHIRIDGVRVHAGHARVGAVGRGDFRDVAVLAVDAAPAGEHR